MVRRSVDVKIEFLFRNWTLSTRKCFLVEISDF
jgi:hypothetical protein